ncbi:hypothetical protein F442_03370 [Phytophthora nicotianae P10297]|uniref:Uncharacterized protein n=4 Tax=Phytophthora nicotianae TaxID=4792 RepID=W2QQ24_PHYN3|nr:hypothetical protein PPTG_07956 [Phytophthora nicotianae INRA-310]ETK93584.1 hypothetical protein L915_03268 [Phytophthora nicotianae]ETO82393.1 hypothetical protein F444_03468 [Phytophthora nicotianae P1976]ETP51520.1 hypothetical protein F442_03370 [Phytophthora nicotianae P10297]ETL46977.1 hypothetical protein L916_03236 [Phytophthora nicotianae]ETM00086.1 hypothetical protein L917_03161 [Phytophthora nicotianae]
MAYRPQLSWVWEEQLQQKFVRCMVQLEVWRDELRPGAFTKYYKKRFTRRD